MSRLIQGVAVLYSLSQVQYGHRKLHCRERGNTRQATGDTQIDTGCAMFRFQIKMTFFNLFFLYMRSYSSDETVKGLMSVPFY